MMKRSALCKLVEGKWPMSAWVNPNEWGVYFCRTCGARGDLDMRFCPQCGSFMDNHERVFAHPIDDGLDEVIAERMRRMERVKGV